jgi:alkylation response protein AidB-like acyl-CoA dehydrogenase
MDFSLTPSQELLRGEAREFAYDRLRPAMAELEWKSDPRERIPWDLVEEASKRGWRTMGVPPQFGGHANADALTFCILIEELAAGDMGFAAIIDQTLKISRIIARTASHEQQEWFWPWFLADPRFVLAICLTEREHGSDYIVPYEDFRFTTRAVRDGDDWLLNGEKRYISNGADAGLYVVFACSNPDLPAWEGTSAFLVPADTPGIERPKIWEKISQRGINNATVRFSDVRVPDRLRIPEVEQGAPGAHEILKESAIEAAATTLGSARAAYEEAHAYARRRVQGGQPLIRHPNVAIRLAWMATRLEAARSLVWRAASEVDHNPAYDRTLGSMAKVFAAETALEVAKEACELHGALGIMIGESLVEKTFRDTLSFLHSDGTQDAHLLRVGKALGERRSVLPGDLLTSATQ